MSRLIQGLYTDPDGTPLVGNVIVTCLESYSDVLKGTVDTFPLDTTGGYSFTLNDGKYSFAVELTAVKPVSKVYVGVGVVTSGDTAVTISAVIAISNVAPPSIKQIYTNLDTIVDAVKADGLSGVDYEINNIITTTNVAVDINELSIRYGGTWEAIGSQTVGADTVYYFERVSDITNYTLTVTDVEII